jgi:hypothetical protein
VVALLGQLVLHVVLQLVVDQQHLAAVVAAEMATLLLLLLVAMPCMAVAVAVVQLVALLGLVEKATMAARVALEAQVLERQEPLQAAAVVAEGVAVPGLVQVAASS